MTNQAINKSFIIHKDSLSVLNKLTDEQAGKLFKAIFYYQINNVLPEDTLTSIIFEPFLNQFKRDDVKYQNVVERNKINGSKGGRPKTQENPLGYLAIQENPKEPKKADSDSKSDSKSNSKNDSNNDQLTVTKNNLFETFWQKYEPIHTSKGSKKDAEKKFSKIIKKESFDDIMAGLERYMSYCKTKNSYTKAVSTWLNSEGWKDDHPADKDNKIENEFPDLTNFINKTIGEDVIYKLEIKNNEAIFYQINDEKGNKLFSSSKDKRDLIKEQIEKISTINNWRRK